MRLYRSSASRFTLPASRFTVHASRFTLHVLISPRNHQLTKQHPITSLQPVIINTLRQFAIISNRCFSILISIALKNPGYHRSVNRQ